MPCVYVLLSEKTNKYYKGSSREDIPNTRLYRHNAGLVISTKSGGPWKLIHFEYFEEYSAARKRELFLKSGAGRAWIRANFSNL